MGTVVVTRSPTFKTKVEIPDPEAPLVCTMEFKRMRRKDFIAYFKPEDVEKRDEIDTMMGVLVGWDLEPTFSREAVQDLFEDFHAAPRTILMAYMDAQAQFGAKN